MNRHFDVTDRFSLQTEQQSDSIWAQEASDAWKANSAAASPVQELEKLIDRKINRTTTSEDDRQPMKDLAHAIAEKDLAALDKIVKELGKDPESIARLTKQLQEAFRATGLRFTVSYDASNNVLEVDDQGGLTHLYIFAASDRAPMGTIASSVPFKDMKESGISEEKERVMKENAQGAADALQKSMLRRFGDLSGK